jgi:hypothetical protein
MAGWLSRLAVVIVTLIAATVAGGAVLGAAAAETHVTELLATCLSCGERWTFVPSASVGAGLLSLFRRRTPSDKCPKCGSRAVSFGHSDAKENHGRTA